MGEIEVYPLDLRCPALPGDEINPLHPSSEKIEPEPLDLRCPALPVDEINPCIRVKIRVVLSPSMLAQRR